MVAPASLVVHKRLNLTNCISQIQNFGRLLSSSYIHDRSRFQNQLCLAEAERIPLDSIAVVDSIFKQPFLDFSKNVFWQWTEVVDCRGHFRNVTA